MTRFVGVSREAHAHKVWRRFANYQFAAKDALASIVLAEVVHVGAWMPIVFIEEAGRYVLMAMSQKPLPVNLRRCGETCSRVHACARHVPLSCKIEDIA